VTETSGIQFPAGAPGPTQPAMQWVPGAVSPWVTLQGHDADHSPSYSAKVKNAGAIPPLELNTTVPFYVYLFIRVRERESVSRGVRRRGSHIF
jgi:hypothetical protein